MSTALRPCRPVFLPDKQSENSVETVSSCILTRPAESVQRLDCVVHHPHQTSRVRTALRPGRPVSPPDQQNEYSVETVSSFIPTRRAEWEQRWDLVVLYPHQTSRVSTDLRPGRPVSPPDQQSEYSVETGSSCIPTGPAEWVKTWDRVVLYSNRTSRVRTALVPGRTRDLHHAEH